MKSFEEHLRGAKAHNREDKIWLVTCFSGKMAKLCAKYGFPDDEDEPGILLRDISRQCEPMIKAAVGQLHGILLVGLGSF